MAYTVVRVILRGRDGMHVAGKKKKKAVKDVVEKAVAKEKTAKTAKKAAPKSDKRDKHANTKGVWEVSLDSGVVIGYFEGTPAKIGSYVGYFHKEGRYIRKLNFVKVNIEPVPRQVFQRVCCNKKFISQDKYCSRCGKKLRFELPVRKNIKLTVEIPSSRSLESSKW